MNVFIDLGCYNGDTVEEFKNWRRVAFPGREDWVIHGFDPNPYFEEAWSIIPDVEFHQKAAWIEDGKSEFSLSDIGSTLMKSKNTWDAGEKVTVETFDFSEWVKQFKDDFVVLKMDIEGAEFLLLDKMINDGTITIPDWLMVEFHPNKVAEYNSRDKDIFIERIKNLKVRILEWH